MRLARFLLLLLLLSSALLLIGAQQEEDEDESLDSADSDNEEDTTIGLNPDYVGPAEEEDGYDSDVELEDEEEESGKSKTNKALKKSKKSSNNKTLSFLKKHRLKITIAMVLVAFHREIARWLLNVIKPEVYDPATQTKTRQWMKLEPTQILKIIVFIDVMRQLQSAGEKKKDPILLALLLLGARNPILSSIVSKALLQENSSYVPPVEQHYTFERLNERYKKDCLALQKAAKVKRQHKENLSLSSLSHLRDGDSKEESFSETVILLDLGNINTSPGRIDVLRDEVSFLIHQHHQQSIPYASSDKDNSKTKELEILVLLESPGGSAADFALASQQLLRLRRQAGIKVTVCVDKVAASGGYMIACASSPGRLFAAPFAILGSIGVVGQTVNVQKTLEGWGVRPMVFKAGKDKAPIGLIGDIKPSDVQSIQTMVDETHEAFKRHVATARPILKDSIESLATGKVWMGYHALEVGLIDRLLTSDEYIGERIQEGARLLKLIRHNRKRGILGGPQPRPGFEGRLQSSILAPLKNQAVRTLNSFVGRLNLPEEVEDLDEVQSPLVSSPLQPALVSRVPLKDQAMKTLNSFIGSLNLPQEAEELDEVAPLVSRVGYKNIETTMDASFSSSYPQF